jgi:predicted small lipoprotein YifL
MKWNHSVESRSRHGVGLRLMALMCALALLGACGQKGPLRPPVAAPAKA